MRKCLVNMWFSKKIVSDTFFAVFHKIKQEKKSTNREKWIAMILCRKIEKPVVTRCRCSVWFNLTKSDIFKRWPRFRFSRSCSFTSSFLYYTTRTAITSFFLIKLLIFFTMNQDSRLTKDQAIILLTFHLLTQVNRTASTVCDNSFESEKELCRLSLKGRVCDCAT